MNYKLLLIGFFSLILNFNLFCSVFVFDIGGVLIDTDKYQSFKYMGLTDTLTYFSKHGTKISFSLRSKLFEVLQETQDFVPGIIYNAKDDHGFVIPPIMLDWLKGTEDNYLLLQKAKKTIANKPHLFENNTERNLITSLVELMFDPQVFTTTRKPLNPMIDLLQKLYNQKDSKNKRMHTILLCSNWDKQSYELCKLKFPEIFNYIDGQIISSQENLLKPDSAIFKKLKEKYSVDPYKTQSIFIDDQLENRIAGRSEGFISVHPKHAYALCKTLKIIA
jgi:FMN phosphatase YigB (HAD superfamily)